MKKIFNSDSISLFGRLNYNPKLNTWAKKMSSEMTPAEKNIWFKLLYKKQFYGYKFIKQKIIYNYIIDFYCSKLNLVIEIDGHTHDIDYDKERDSFLKSIGITTIRFTNQDALYDVEGVKTVLDNYRKSILNL